MFYIFFFKQKTAYEMRISDWSSDVCSSDLALARAKLCDDGSYEAHVIRKLDRQPQRVLGVYEIGSEGGRLRPTDKRAKKDFVLRSSDAGGATPGELVLAEILPARRQRDSLRSEERRVGKEWCRTCRSRWSPYH